MIPARPSVTSIVSTVATREAATSGGKSATNAPARCPAGWPQPRRTIRSTTNAATRPRIAEGKRTAHSSAPKTRTIPERSHGNRIGVPDGSPRGVVDGASTCAPPCEDVARADRPAPLVRGEEIGAAEEDQPEQGAGRERRREEEAAGRFGIFGANVRRTRGGVYGRRRADPRRGPYSSPDARPGRSAAHGLPDRARRGGPPPGGPRLRRRSRTRSSSSWTPRRRTAPPRSPRRPARASSSARSTASARRRTPPPPSRRTAGSSRSTPTRSSRRALALEIRSRLAGHRLGEEPAGRVPDPDPARVPGTRAPLRARHGRQARAPLRPHPRALLRGSRPREGARERPGRGPRRVHPPPLVPRSRALPREARPLHDARGRGEVGGPQGRHAVPARAGRRGSSSTARS